MSGLGLARRPNDGDSRCSHFSRTQMLCSGASTNLAAFFFKKAACFGTQPLLLSRWPNLLEPHLKNDFCRSNTYLRSGMKTKNVENCGWLSMKYYTDRGSSPIVEHREGHRHFRTIFVAEKASLTSIASISTADEPSVRAALALTFEIINEKINRC